MSNLISISNINSLEDVKVLRTSLEDQIQEGNTDALQVFHELSLLEKTIKTIKESKILKESALNEVELYEGNKKSFVSGVIESSITKTVYDFSNSSAWVTFKQEIEILDEKLKEIEKLAKITKSKTYYIDPETGDQMEVLPAIKRQTTGLKYTINKK